MRRYVLHDQFSIYHFESELWTHPLHNHTYFEIIFIIKGKGIHNINHEKFEYQSGDVYFIAPEDSHSFDIEQLTEFSFVRFNEAFFADRMINNVNHPIMGLLQTASNTRKSVVEKADDKIKLHSLLEILEAECSGNNNGNFVDIRLTLVQSMILILKRSLLEFASKKVTNNTVVEQIIVYVKQNIFFPETLKIKVIADKFNLASSYVSIFFKNQTGESLKEFIVRYRIKLLETRLRYGHQSLAELAFEFGYVDESHLCRQFRRYTGTSPIHFRIG